MTVPDPSPVTVGLGSMGVEKCNQFGPDRLRDQIPCALAQQIRQWVG